MADDARRDAVIEALEAINRAWTGGRFDVLEALLHPEIVLAPPGFAARERGRNGFVAGHRDFYERAAIEDFREREHQVDVMGDVAVATYRYELLYESGGERYRSTGRDLWVMRLQGDAWVAVWRTVLEVEERAA